MRHPQSHPKTSARSDPSSCSARAQCKHQVLKSTLRPLSHPSSPIAANALDAGSSSALSVRGSSSDPSDTRLDHTLDKGVAEPDATDSDVDVNDDSRPSDSHEARIETTVAGPLCNKGVSDIKAEGLISTAPSLSTSESPSLSPIVAHLSRSSPPTSMEVPSRQDESLEHSLQLPSEACSGDDTASALASPSEGGWWPAWESSPAPCQGERWKRRIAFPRNSELSKERMKIIRDYMANSDTQRDGGGVSEASVAKAFEGVSEVWLFIDCPGWLGDDDKEHRGRRWNAITSEVQRLSAIVSDSLRGLQVTAPWPELSFPYVPDILAAIVDSLPSLERLRFEDLQCRCHDCKSLYTDTAKFTRLQAAALEGQISRPITSTNLRRLSIERKSMNSLGKDFIKYTGEAEREALLGSWTVIQNGHAAWPTARAEQESQFFAKLLKRCLPSIIGLLLVTPELRLTYAPLSSPAKRPSLHSVRSSKSPEVEPERDSPVPATPSFSRSRTQRTHRESSCTSGCTCSTSGYSSPPDDGVTTPFHDLSSDLSGDVSPRDDVSGEPAQDVIMNHAAWCPPNDALAQGYEDLGLCFHPEGPSDPGSFTLGNGVDDSEFDPAVYHAFAVSIQGGPGYGPSPGDGGLNEHWQPLASVPAWSYGSAASSFGGDSEATYTGPSSSVLHAPIQYWAPLDLDCQQPSQIVLEGPGIANAGDPGPRLGWYGQEDSAVVVSEELCSLGSADGTTWTWFSGSGSESTVLAAPMPSENVGMYAYVEHPTTCGYPEPSRSIPSCQYEPEVDGGPDSGSMMSDENLVGLDENGEHEGYRRLWGGMNVSCPEA